MLLGQASQYPQEKRGKKVSKNFFPKKSFFSKHFLISSFLTGDAFHPFLKRSSFSHENVKNKLLQSYSINDVTLCDLTKPLTDKRYPDDPKYQMYFMVYGFLICYNASLICFQNIIVFGVSHTVLSVVYLITQSQL